MKTEALIRALAADDHRPVPTLKRIMMERLLPGLAIAIGVYAILLGVRPQLFSLIGGGDMRIAFKIALMLLLAALAVPLTLGLARPAADLRGIGMALMSVPILLAIAILIELFVVPEADWSRRLIGHNASFCLRSIPLLALAPLVALLLALRQGAPARPALAGAGAGLLAGAIGAALYATHCPDDSPFFVAAWYSLGIAIVTVAGAAIGARLLRW